MVALRMLFHVGGPRFHPVAEQAALIREWMADRDHEVTIVEGNAAFDHLPDCDIFVLMGLYWTGQGETPPYVALSGRQREAFRTFVRAGRPILAHHGGIASYDDWAEFGALVGFQWVWGKTTHSPFGEYTVRVTDPAALLVAGVTDFQVHDEIYYDVAMDPGVKIHAVAQWDGQDRGMVCTLQGRATGTGGRVVYLANGHDLRTFQTPAMRRLWRNATDWLAE